MAGCERGYLCTVCGRRSRRSPTRTCICVTSWARSTWEVLHDSPERHIRCNPVLAQFIVTELFPPITVEGPFSKDCLDPEFVKSEEARVTRGYLRLHEVQTAGVPIC